MHVCMMDKMFYSFILSMSSVCIFSWVVKHKCNRQQLKKSFSVKQTMQPSGTVNGSQSRGPRFKSCRSGSGHFLISYFAWVKKPKDKLGKYLLKTDLSQKDNVKIYSNVANCVSNHVKRLFWLFKSVTPKKGIFGEIIKSVKNAFPCKILTHLKKYISSITF